MMGSHSTQGLSSEAFVETVQRLAAEIANKAGTDTPFVLVGIRTRGVHLAHRLASELQAKLEREVPVGILDINLYRDDTAASSAQPVVRKTELPFDIEGARILLVDDVLFTGRTIRAAISALIDYGRPKCVELVVMVDRGFRELPIQADYVGLRVETKRAQRVDVLMQEQDGEDRVVIRDVN